MKLIYPAVFTPCEEGGFTVDVVDLPGCVSEGDILIEAMENGTDAASGWILTALEDGDSVPQASRYSDVAVPDGSFVNLLIADIDTYAEKYGSKTVRKSITIPAWLNTYGEKNNINFSKVLSDALIKQAASLDA